MKEKVFNTINGILKERDEAHIEPRHALLTEIINRGCKTPQKALNELFKEGRIKWHRTLNDIAFTINNEQNE